MAIVHTHINEETFLADPIEVERMKIGVAFPEDADTGEAMGEGHVLITIDHNNQPIRLVFALDMAQALLDRLPNAIAMAQQKISAILTTRSKSP